MGVVSGQGDPLPTDPKPYRYPVLIVPPGDPLELVITSDTWLGMLTHWWKRPTDPAARTHPCLAPRACVCLSEVEVPSKWHGYLGVVRWHSQMPAILSCTSDTIDSILDLTGDLKTLRGLCVLLKRASVHKSARVVAELNPKRWQRQLPPPPDMMPTLSSIYGAGVMATWQELHPRAGAAS